MTDAEAQAFLQRKSNEIAEHFDAVQIVASYLLPNGYTACIAKGSGNYYARKAMCQEFVERDQARTVADEIARAGTPPEGDEWKTENPS